jgi:hypothetical protein
MQERHDFWTPPHIQISGGNVKAWQMYRHTGLSLIKKKEKK